MLNAIKTFEQYRSIPKINELNSADFSLEDVKKVTSEMGVLKASQLLDIPTKTIRQNDEIFSEFFFVNINHSINNNNFPEEIKWADLKPVSRTTHVLIKKITG